MNEKDHQYFFGENPELPGHTLIWSGVLRLGDLISFSEFADILDSLKLDGVTLFNNLCLFRGDGDVFYLYYTGEKNV